MKIIKREKTEGFFLINLMQVKLILIDKDIVIYLNAMSIAVILSGCYVKTLHIFFLFDFFLSLTPV